MVAVGERPRVTGTIESGRMHQVHLVKPGANKGVRIWDPKDE